MMWEGKQAAPDSKPKVRLMSAESPFDLMRHLLQVEHQEGV